MRDNRLDSRQMKNQTNRPPALYDLPLHTLGAYLVNHYQEKYPCRADHGDGMWRLMATHKLRKMAGISLRNATVIVSEMSDITRAV